MENQGVICYQSLPIEWVLFRPYLAARYLPEANLQCRKRGLCKHILKQNQFGYNYYFSLEWPLGYF